MGSRPGSFSLPGMTIRSSRISSPKFAIRDPERHGSELRHNGACVRTSLVGLWTVKWILQRKTKRADETYSGG
jgi:hypothetical protein